MDGVEGRRKLMIGVFYVNPVDMSRRDGGYLR